MEQTEVENFARFFVNELKIKKIPWSLNVLDDYYDTEKSEWISGVQTLPCGKKGREWSLRWTRFWISWWKL